MDRLNVLRGLIAFQCSIQCARRITFAKKKRRSAALFSLMPIYEFFCRENNKIYSFFARSLAYASASPRCPDNPKFSMEKTFSSFSITGRAKEAAGSAAAVDDPALELAMAKMEREFDSMNSDHPDPRQLAQMLRTVTKISGEKMPDQMEEMTRRLEAGEALDKLEEKFGDMADASGGEDALLRSDELEAIKERLRVARHRTRRDPVLYEMSDYAELPQKRPTEPSGRSRRMPSR